MLFFKFISFSFTLYNFRINTVRYCSSLEPSYSYNKSKNVVLRRLYILIMMIQYEISLNFKAWILLYTKHSKYNICIFNIQ